MKYPESVPLLTGKQFTCGVLFENEKRKKCCLLGWAVEVFTDRGPQTAYYEQQDDYSARKYVEASYTAVPNKIRVALAKAAYDIPEVRSKFSYYESKKEFVEDFKDDIPAINDDETIPRKCLAQIWNNAMKSLGYTEEIS